MKLIPLMVVGLFLALPAFAWSQSAYDWRTGNSYHSYQTPTGTKIQGSNFRTGSSWNTNVNNNGSMNGRDSQGNYWNYNQQTGTYMNYGTGKTCVGRGYARICN